MTTVFYKANSAVLTRIDFPCESLAQEFVRALPAPSQYAYAPHGAQTCPPLRAKRTTSTFHQNRNQPWRTF